MIFGVIPKPKLVFKVSYTETNTQNYDKLAFKYLSWVLFPLVFGYSIYSLIYWEHKGWYSWVLNMVYGFLLTFGLYKLINKRQILKLHFIKGFIMMTPQLFINYKLKSVAHLPWRMMTYKALNTFIDDIFAFGIFNIIYLFLIHFYLNSVLK